MEQSVQQQGPTLSGEGTYSSRGRTLLGTAVRVDAKSWSELGDSWLGLPRSRWTDPDIRIFLQEWEVVEAEIGHPGRKIHKKTRALCQRLFHRGLKKSWQSCFDLLVSLQYLHRKLCSERPRTEPLFSPYAEALYRILGHRPQGSYFPGPPKYGAGYPLYPMDPQLPMVIPSAPYQPCHYGLPAPSPRLQGYQWSMMSCGHSGHPAFFSAAQPLPAPVLETPVSTNSA
ncbi:putative uncharacterized protein MSANTD5 [Phodopus roborovskii]|uniref:putative uncharacterized protein MSANTD5 n=1 Tax=Phodopus roborovskii TaxID=109678 RepID=UPI0021E4619D|nr:putative uncharacterized protein MSANTD5 [Phodopus roborovskii]